MSSISTVSSATAPSSWDALFSTSKSAPAQKDDSLASKLFGDLDADGSGSISLKESGLRQETYGTMDSDKDGLVSLAELETALELQRSAMFTKIKIEGDMLPYGEDGEGGKPDAQEFLASIMNDQATGQPTKQQETSLKSSSFNMLGMLLESLFLAELEEGKAPTSDANGDPATQQKMQEKPNNLLNDGGKVAEIKKIIEDFSTGKASLSDLPKAMSLGKSETYGVTLKNTNISGKDDTKKD